MLDVVELSIMCLQSAVNIFT